MVTPPNAGRHRPGGALHPRGRQGIFIPWPLGDSHRTRPDGYTFFYGQETPERVAFPQIPGDGQPTHQIEDIVPIVRFLATEG